MSKNPLLEAEIVYRESIGSRRLSVSAFAAEFAALGYALDRDMDCRSLARYLHDGRTYPCCSTSVNEADTGKSAFHYQARRDSNFRAMQILRSDIFAISRGAILEV